MSKFRQLPSGSVSSFLLTAAISLAIATFAGVVTLAVMFWVVYELALGDFSILLLGLVPMTVGVLTLILTFRKIAY